MRKALNLGHTFGHAYEASLGYSGKLNHGEAVILGIASATTFSYITNRKFRDVSSWYHLWVRIDTTDSTSGDRVQLWINGVRETSFSTATAPSENADTVALNQNKTHFFVHIFELAHHHLCLLMWRQSLCPFFVSEQDGLALSLKRSYLCRVARPFFLLNEMNSCGPVQSLISCQCTV